MTAIEKKDYSTTCSAMPNHNNFVAVLMERIIPVIQVSINYTSDCGHALNIKHLRTHILPTKRVFVLFPYSFLKCFMWVFSVLKVWHGYSILPKTT